MMKKLLLFFVLLSMSSLLSQNTFPFTGNVGIGTTSPIANLDILGNSNPQIRIKSTLTNTTGWIDLGIATCNSCFSNIALKGDAVLRTYPSGVAKNLIITNKNGGAIIFGNSPSSDNDVNSMQINKIGNVSMGNITDVDGLDVYKLSVKGKMRANSVKVYTTWADYVFLESYSLPTLEEVESYIKINGHLKDIPSAEEVEKNGIELGEMNKLLLQKIEELTLYMIEMKKEIENLKKS